MTAPNVESNLPKDTSVDVSVIIPTYRREREVVHAVESALRQPGVRVEVLVLDDSPDASARANILALKDDRIRYVAREVPSGGRPALVRNEGIGMARGRYVHGLDDDDRLADGALRELVRLLDARPDVGVAFGAILPFGDDPTVLDRQRRYFRRARAVARRAHSRARLVSHLLFEDTCLVNSACTIRREFVAAIGGYDPHVPICEDAEFYLRAIRAFGYVFHDDVVVHYRTGASSLMHDNRDDAKFAEAYRIMHAKYKQTYGTAEFYALKLLDRAERFAAPKLTA